ncbi:MAG: hypothetical protein ABSH51_06160 [Solirubrobacteraceae bacterium]|jgi:hypothetical protein
MKRAADTHASAVVDARLGRPPRDVIEATVVLEAWGGRPARTAMAAARNLLPRGIPPLRINGRVDQVDGDEQHGVVVEGIALVLSILSVAAWARPLSRALGVHTFGDAIRVALPVAVALQWGLRSRYLSRRTGLTMLGRDGLRCGLIGIAVELALLLLGRWGPIAAMLVAIWVAGTVMTRRGWGGPYAASLVASSIGLDDHASAYGVLGGLTALTVVGCVVAVLTRRMPSDERPGPARRGLLAALLGACVGILLVGDPSLGWGVHGVHPAIALVPSVIGSLWGGYFLWNLYEAVPRGLRGVSLGGASRMAVRDPAMAIFIGALARLVGATIVLSGVVLAADSWTHGTDAPSVFVAFGAMALVSTLVGLLESLGRHRAALVAVTAALAVEYAWPHLVHSGLAGGGLIAGATVGVLLTVPLLAALLTRSGRLLATTLWIQ